MELKMEREETSSTDSLSEVLQRPAPEAGVNLAAFTERWTKDESISECSITSTPVNVKKQHVSTRRQFCASLSV
jgi:hypothetical protein